MSDNTNSKQQIRKKKPQEGQCSKCGHINPVRARFCEECGNPLGGQICPNCGAPVPKEGDICENCGTWMLEGRCCFCSTEIPAGASFCPECGNPVGGIVCKQCGTLSYFDYCPECHTNLTEHADEMVEFLKKEPVIKEYLKTKQEYADILQQYSQLRSAIQPEEESLHEPEQESHRDVAAEIAAAAKRRKTKHLSRQDSSRTGAERKEPTTAGVPEERPDRPAPDTADTREDKDNRESEKEARRKRLEELKARGEALKKKLETPPPVPQTLTTNQEIRRYHMAIKPPFTKGWLCNAFNVIHNDPMHCTRPGDGGTWITE